MVSLTDVACEVRLYEYVRVFGVKDEDDDDVVKRMMMMMVMRMLVVDDNDNLDVKRYECIV